MSSLRDKLFDDMSIWGLLENTKKSYIRPVNGLIQYYRRALAPSVPRKIRTIFCILALQGIQFYTVPDYSEPSVRKGFYMNTLSDHFGITSLYLISECSSFGRKSPAASELKRV